MYLAYKYAKKKYRERQEAKRAVQPLPDETEPCTQDGARFNDTIALTASPNNTHDPFPFDTSHPTLAAEDSSKVTQQESRKPEDAESPEERAEKARRRRYRLKIILGLFAPFTLQALDTTIIASALKFIADDFS
jgi:hypothetical protein